MIFFLVGNARVIALSQVQGLVRRPLREGGTFEAHGHRADDDHGRHEDEEHEGEEHAKENVAAHGDDDHDAHRRGAFDMHIWLDPVNAGVMARTIVGVLSEADPANAGTYAANAQALLPRLEELTAQIAAEVAPVRGKPFIVFHDGYRYFEDRFGLTAAGSSVVSPDRSPGVRRISELRDKMRELGVTCVFAEPQYVPRPEHADDPRERSVARLVERRALGGGKLVGGAVSPRIFHEAERAVVPAEETFEEAPGLAEPAPGPAPEPAPAHFGARTVEAGDGPLRMGEIAAVLRGPGAAR